MKNILFIIMTMVVHSGFSQQSTISKSNEDKILAHIGDEIMSKIKSERPQHLNYYNYMLKESFVILDKASATKKGLQTTTIKKVIFKDFLGSQNELSSQQVIEAIQNDNFNILISDIPRDKNSRVYFELKGTGKVLVMKSEEELVKTYNSRK